MLQHRELLIISGISEITFAVYLGWFLGIFIWKRNSVSRGVPSGHHGKDAVKTAAVNINSVGPFRSFKRLLQAHIDYILMGILQLVVACSIVSDLGTQISPVCIWLLIAGAWSNPSLFLLAAILPEKEQRTKLSRVTTILSFLTLTIAFTWLTVQYVVSCLN